MKMKKTVMTFCLLSCILGIVSAAGEDPIKAFPQRSIGVQIGELSGYGLSYQDRFSDLDALQTTVWFSLNGNPSSYETFLEYMIGLEYQHTVYSNSYSDWLLGQLYLFGAISHYASLADANDWGTFEPNLALGGGVGVEVLFLDHFSMPIEFGYDLLWERSNTSFFSQFDVGFVAQIGIRYRF
ncbi:hypothetical protein [uncultured Sphaerochaeta sp.]|uniref:hypothetical protein n=1 Tax=uncultured Sphaerochaeta sp. TaxID=886478 RepID=UPI002A0A225C|nr:hypothetical protein [uncultured Sphaerochaeta sp.]